MTYLKTVEEARIHQIGVGNWGALCSNSHCGSMCRLSLFSPWTVELLIK